MPAMPEIKLRHSTPYLLMSWDVLELFLLLPSLVKDVAPSHSTWPLRSQGRRHPSVVKIERVTDGEEVRRKIRQEKSKARSPMAGQVTFLYGSDGAALQGHSSPLKPQSSRP